MPIYEYHCQSCGHTFEILQKFSDPALHECPRCSAQVQRLISVPALVFKGQGWYVNEFPSQDRKKGLDGEKGNGNGGKKKVDEPAKSPSKEEPKSESKTK